MALDGITIRNICKELRASLTGARISRIAQPEADALLLTLKTNDRQQVRLLLSASASLPLIYTTQKNQASPALAPNFCMLLRKHIGNGRVIRIWQPGLERIIHFEIEHYDEMGDLCRKDLILELMGKHSNLIFCDDKGIIIDSIKHISAQTSSVREVLPGREYFIPVTRQQLDPLTAGEDEFRSMIFSKPLPLSKAIYSSCTGISPVIAEELCHRCGVESAQSALSIPEIEQTHLYHLFSLMMDDVREENFTPCIIFDPSGNPVEFSAIPLTMYNDYTVKHYDSMGDILEQYYQLRNTVTRIRQKSADLRHITATACDRTRKKLQLQQKQLQDTEKRDKNRLYGELLHTYGYEASPGDKALKVINYYNGEEVTIPLDPTISAAENAKRYFDRYSKQKRTFEALSVQIEETQADLAQLESIQTFLEMALSESDLAAVREELTQAGYIKKHPFALSGRKNAGRKVPGKQEKAVSAPYHYRSQDGYDIYVGKNNFQNDYLTFHFSGGQDWWFHAKGVPGSHVILKVQDAETPDRAFEDAARLAAWYSKNRDSGKVDVDYVRRKEVKKPGGAKPGFVVYYTNYSMTIEPDISSLVLIE